MTYLLRTPTCSLGWLCTCVCSKCLKKSKRYHCGVKTRGCFRQMQ